MCQLWALHVVTKRQFLHLFESVTDIQTYANIYIFFAPGGVRNPIPTKLGVVIDEVHAILAPPKCIRRIVSSLGALKIWGQHAPLNLNLINVEIP